MASSQLSTDEYLTALRQNGLVVAGELDAALKDFDATGHERSLDAVGQALIDRQLITLWQHRRVVRGQARQCFLDKYKLLAPLNPKGDSTTFLAVHTRMRSRGVFRQLLRKLCATSSPAVLTKPAHWVQPIGGARRGSGSRPR